MNEVKRQEALACYIVHAVAEVKTTMFVTIIQEKLQFSDKIHLYVETWVQSLVFNPTH